MLLENYESKSVIVSTTLRRVDVFSLLMDETDSTAYCNYVKVADGTVVNNFTVQLSVGAGADEKEVLSRAISDISEKLSGQPRPRSHRPSAAGRGALRGGKVHGAHPGRPAQSCWSSRSETHASTASKSEEP